MNASQTSDRLWPLPSTRWAMRMSWHDLLFMHWPVPEFQIAQYVPAPLRVDTFENQAWIGLVPFRMAGVAPRWSPDIPGMSAFPEFNVRTYVTIDGKPGVWFFSLDATNPIAVRLARRCFHLPYLDARIDVATGNDGTITFHSIRTDTNAASAEFEATYRPTSTPFYAKPGSLEFFLTARYCLYASDRRLRILRGEIDHAPWALQHAECSLSKNSMLNGLQITLPNEEPHLLFARSTHVVAWQNVLVGNH